MRRQAFLVIVALGLAISVCSAADPAKEQLKAEVERLAKDLGSPKAETRRAAALGLAQHGKAAAPYAQLLVEAFTDPELAKVRPALAEAFAVMGPEARVAVPALIAALNDKDDADLRQAAVSALRWIKTDADKVVPALLKCLDDPSIKLRVTTLWALATYGTEAKAAVPVLLKHLKAQKEGAELRFPIIGALARVGRGDARAADAIVPLLEKEKDNVIILESIGKLGPVAKRAIPQLVAVLKSAQKDERTNQARAMAAVALGQMGREVKQAEVDVLAQALRDKTNARPIRRAAARALKDLGPKVAKSAIPALVDTFREQQVAADESREALLAMGKDAVPAVADSLKNAAHAFIKEQTLRLLDAMGPDAKGAAPAIEAELMHRDPNVVLWAKRALASVQAPSPD